MTRTKFFSTISNKHRLVFALVAIIFAPGLTGCESEEADCYIPVEAYALCGFRLRDTTVTLDTVSNENGVIVTTPVVEYTFADSQLTAPVFQLLDHDSVFVVNGVAGTVTMPAYFDPGADSIRYRFLADTSSDAADTLTFYYTPYLYFVSNSCGYTYFYTLDTVHSTRHLIDSATILDNDITNSADTRNINLYFIRKF
ncbi:MAG: DUF6452 family protein [Edaphocola sp.]